jgi:hypothetical protein
MDIICTREQHILLLIHCSLSQPYTRKRVKLFHLKLLDLLLSHLKQPQKELIAKGLGNPENPRRFRGKQS